jgi:hypothetical protein
MTAHYRRGALAALEPRTGAQRTVLAFQYNPETLIRQLLPGAPIGGGDPRPGPSRPGDPPCEEVFFSFDLDAAEGLERPDPQTVRLGLLPALSALEMLFDGAAAAVWRLEAGTHLVTAEPPLLLLIWGENRRAPVRIAACTIAEEAFDADLVPIRARVDLALQVLTYGDALPTHPGRRLFREYMETRERLAGAYRPPAGAEA